MLPEPRDLYVYNGGLFRGHRVRRILELSGWNVRLGLPKSDEDWVGIWGNSPTSYRGKHVAQAKNAPLLRVEDAFLRSVLTGRSGEPPLGLCLDMQGLHFDPARPSDLENLLNATAFDDTALLDAARAGIERMNYWRLSKYNDFDPRIDLPEAPYVLVLDQTRGDASVTASGANVDTFRDMLVQARADHPGNRIIIKSHPETAAGHRIGHFDDQDLTDRVSILSDPVNPFALMQGATAVYTISSQLGFEAIFAGHKPRVFGQPFYAGWGLTIDEQTFPRRNRELTRAQLFAGAMMLYPKWYDPHADALCSVDQIIDILSARARAHSQDRHGHHALNMRRWKHPHIRSFFGGNVTFRASDSVMSPLIWGAGETQASAPIRVEDGFLRSRGLGASLVPPLSLVADETGIYYDPSRPSDLEELISASTELPQAERNRAGRLVAKIIETGTSKYNLPKTPLQDLPDGHRILVPGQVEDDASIRLGCGAIRTNLALLQETRARNPDAVIVYKPHPDVEAGLRAGAIERDIVLENADFVATQSDPAQLIEQVDEVWTMTSLLGFEALLRGKPVTCLGTPFYAGWGLTQDFGELHMLRRSARPDITAMAHAVLIGYPRYFDPVTRTICPPEVALDRLGDSDLPMPPVNKLLAWLQSILPANFRTRERR